MTPDDIFIMNRAGLPFYSKCYGGETCQKHPDHALQSGFIAALYSYAQESFGQDEIKQVVFQDMRLDFHVDKERDIIVMFTSPLGDDQGTIEKKLTVTLSKFVEKYEDVLSSRRLVPVNTFEDFEQELVDLGVVEQKAKKTMKLKAFKKWWKKIFH